MQLLVSSLYYFFLSEHYLFSFTLVLSIHLKNDKPQSQPSLSLYLID